MRPDTFTITTFWGDWAIMPLFLGAAWLTMRWGFDDWKKAERLQTQEKTLPGWAVLLPLCTSSIGFLIIALVVLIKEPYWEHRGLLAGQLLLLACCLIGSYLILITYLRGGPGFGTAGILELIGLLLMSSLLVLPALFVHSSPTALNFATHLWFGLLVICTGCLLSGILLGFPYNFARLPLWIVGLYAFGVGLMEITFRKPGFPNLIYVWDFDLGLNFLDPLSPSPAWLIAGWIKISLAICTLGIDLNLSRRSRRSSHQS